MGAPFVQLPLILLLLAASTGAMAFVMGRVKRMQGLQQAATSPHGVLLFVLGLMAALFVLPLSLALLRSAAWLPELPGPDDAEALPLPLLVGLQALSTAVSAALIMTAAWCIHRRVDDLGLRAHRGASALAWGTCLWVACVPVLVAARLVNDVLLGLLGVDSGVQEQLALFAADPATHSSPIVWLAMVLVIPVGEEIVFRGALYGGLRRGLPAPWAMVISGLIFASLHDVSVFLPVALLGMLLAWAYERTGSLLVPCLVHALQNGLTLLLVATETTS